MLRNGFFSLVSTGVRVLASTVLFIVLAHTWGPEAFGLFMYPFTIAAIVVKLVDYGFALQLMRDIGHSPTEARRIMGLAFGAKLLLIVPTALVAIVVGITLPHQGPYGVLFALLLFDALANSFALFFNTPLRALGRFDTEACIIAGANVALFSVVVTGVAFGAGTVACATFFVIVRLGYLAAAWIGCSRVLGGRLRPEWTREPLMRTLKQGFPFAVHVTVGTLGVHVETIMIQHYMGASAVGLYQAGVRIVLGALLIADALNNVYLEALARTGRDGTGLQQLASRMTRHMLVLGVLAFLCTIGGSDWIVRLLYSNTYDALIPLLPFFGLLMLIRYGGTSYGTLLTLADRQLIRALAVIGMVVLSVAINAALIPRFGLIGAIVAAIFSHIALYSVYVIATWRDHRTLLIDGRSMVLIGVAAVALSLVLLPVDAGASVRFQLGVALVLITTAAGITRTEWSALSRRLARVR